MVRTFLAAAAVPAFVALAQATGKVQILNQCEYSVNLWSCADQDSKMFTIQPNKDYTEDYHSKKGGGGISIKIAINATTLYTYPAPPVPITQLEYTIGGGKVWYDISNINGYPFKDNGVNLTTSDGGGPSVLCPAGVAHCDGAYNKPDDDHATGATADSADLIMVLCVAGSPNTPGSEGSASAGFSSTLAPLPSPTTLKSVPTNAAPSTTAAPPPPPPPPPAAAPTAAPSKGPDVAQDKHAAPQPVAPQPVQEDANGNIVIVTVTAPVAVETVTQVAAAKEKRHEHRHAHAHAQHPHLLR